MCRSDRLIARGSEEDSHYLTKGDNNRVHDQQLYQKSTGDIIYN